MIHPQALVDDPDAVGSETNVWAFAHIMSGARVGSHCNIGDHVFIESGAVVGNNVTIKNQVLIWEGITIEDDVFVGPGVIFTNDRYPRSPRMANVRQRYADKATWLRPTRVRRGASLGAAATICPGLELGHYCMVAAGAVVTKDVPAFSLVMGSPARQVHDVCSCGQKLAGPYQQSDCLLCGETATSRSLLLSSTASSMPS